MSGTYDIAFFRVRGIVRADGRTYINAVALVDGSEITWQSKKTPRANP